LLDPMPIQTLYLLIVPRENFALNGEEYNRLWEGSVNMAKDIYSVVVANIVADVLKIISKDLKSVLKSGGVLIPFRNFR